jgi:hypothetical protein
VYWQERQSVLAQDIVRAYDSARADVQAETPEATEEGIDTLG